MSRGRAAVCFLWCPSRRRLIPNWRQMVLCWCRPGLWAAAGAGNWARCCAGGRVPLFQPSCVPPAPSPRAPAHLPGSWPACSLFSPGPSTLQVPLAGVSVAFPWFFSVGPVGCWRDHGAILPHRAAPGTPGPPAMVPAGTAWPQASRAGQLCREHVSSGKMQLLAATAAVQLVGMSSPWGAAGLGTGWGTSWELCSVPLSGEN